MIAVTFALPQESRDFRHLLRQARTVGPGRSLLGNVGPEEVLLAHTGVGPVAAAEHVAALLAAHRPRLLLSTGFAGGLDPRLATGDLLIATNVSAPALVAHRRSLSSSGPRSCRGSMS